MEQVLSRWNYSHLMVFLLLSRFTPFCYNIWYTDGSWLFMFSLWLQLTNCNCYQFELCSCFRLCLCEEYRSVDTYETVSHNQFEIQQNWWGGVGLIRWENRFQFVVFDHKHIQIRNQNSELGPVHPPPNLTLYSQNLISNCLILSCQCLQFS